MRFLVCALALFLPVSLVEAERADLFGEDAALKAVGAMSDLLGAANHAVDQIELRGGLFDWGHEAERSTTCDGTEPGATIALPDTGRSCSAAPCLGHEAPKAKDDDAQPKHKVRTRVLTA